MSATADTAEFLAPAAEQPAARPAWQAFALRHAGFPIVVAVAATLNIYSLAKNAFANTFYAASVVSMLHSLHNFLYASFDPGGLATIDKPPLAIWAQVLSAKVLGFSPVAILLPEALIGVATVIAIYVITARYLSPAAAFGAALVTAVFPAFVAVSRENGVDPMLILLMTLAACATLAAIHSGRWRSLLGAAVLVGLAYNTKTLAAVLIVPPIAAGYLLCAPGGLPRRLVRLLAAGAVMLLVAASWTAFVELTPAHSRPYVGSSKDNTELNLTFGYNGFGRIEGEYGGPGGVKNVSDGTPQHRRGAPAPQRWSHEKQFETVYMRHVKVLPGGRHVAAVPFGGPVGIFRLFGLGLGDQAGWLVPLGIFGMIGLIAMILTRRRREKPGEGIHLPPRRDPWLAYLVVFGGWLVVEFVVLSWSKGIIHPYYSSALAPGVGAMAGAGIVAIERLLRGHWRVAGVAIAVLALGTTAFVQAKLMDHYLYMQGFIPFLLGGIVACLVCLALLRRYAGAALAIAFALLLIVPTAYAATTWEAPVQGTFPAAGPRNAAGHGLYGIERGPQENYEQLLRYTGERSHPRRYGVLTVSSMAAANLILMGGRAAALAGYSGTDPFPAKKLAAILRSGQARYVVLGGPFWNRGGNEATRAVVHDCTLLEPALWNAPYPKTFGLELFDCGAAGGAMEHYDRVVDRERLDATEAARTKREARSK